MFLGIAASTWLAAGVGITTALSLIGSYNQSRMLRRAAKADKRQREVKKIKDVIDLNKRFAAIMSEQDAIAGARGIAMNINTDRTLKEQNIKDMADAEYWVQKGVELDLDAIDFRLGAALTNESFNRGVNLFTGIYNTFDTYRKG
jgi:hypothetical protein|tara:strand:+ start:74 stop:508 length:435 start_codon:yes stop_codon:yes gene_type:complete